MIYKKRKTPVELRLLEALQHRTNLSAKDQKNYTHLKKGYEGECIFDAMTENLECTQLHDLLLKHNDTVFQIDTLLITQEKIYVYEVKNYVGEFYFDQERFFKAPKQELLNPVHQIGRLTPLLTQLLRKHGFNIPIQSHVIFVNPEFTLFQAQMNTPIILPTQIKNHFRMLNDLPSRLNQNQKRLAEKLVELHLSESPYQKRPEYSYDQVKKGVLCKGCGSLKVKLIGRKIHCNECDFQELIGDGIGRLVKEFCLLFPKRKVTTVSIYEWGGGLISKRSIQYYLQKNLKRNSTSRWTYYEVE